MLHLRWIMVLLVPYLLHNSRAGARTVCKIDIERTRASVKCSGGTIAASFGKGLLSTSIEGVRPAKCTSDCVLTICDAGAGLEIRDSRILETSSKTASFCLQGHTIASMINSTIRMNNGTLAIVRVLEGSKLILHKTNLSENNAGDWGVSAEASVVSVAGAASLSVSKCSIWGNSVNQGGTTLHASNNASLLISNSTVRNLAESCVTATDTATVLITNGTTLSSLSDRQEAWTFYGVTAMGNSTAVITGSSRVTNSSDGGIYAGENARATVSGGSMLDQNGWAARIEGHAAVMITGGAQLLNNSCGIFVPEQSHVTLDGQSTLKSSSACLGGAVTASDYATVVIANRSAIVNNTAEYSSQAGGIEAADNTTVLIRGASRVCGNKTPGDGGGIVIRDNATVTVTEGSMVCNNTAEGDGGGVHVSGEGKFILLEGATIANNSAVNGGGVYATEDAAIVANGGYVSGNRAWDVGEDPATGGGLCVGYNVSLVLTNGTSISNNNAGTEGGGVYAGDSATVNLGPACTFLNNTAGLLGDDVRAGFNNTVNFGESVNINMLSSSVFWTRLNCVTGEILDGGFCKQCGLNFYSLSPASERCYVCPSKAACPGGDVIAPLAGHWHSHRYATQVHACPNEEVCLEGGVCSPEYTGHLCGSCGEGSGYAGPFKCAACNSRAIVLLLYFSGALALLLFICYTLHTTMADNQGACTTAADGAAQLPSARPSDLLKVFIKHMQYLIILGSLQVPWPDALVTTFRGMAWMFSSADSSLLVPLDCLLSDGGLPKAIKRQLVYVTAPIAFTLVTVLVLLLVRVVRRWSASRACTPNCHEQEPQHQPEMGTESIAYCMPALVLIVLFLFHPSLVHVGLTMFACYPLDKVPAPPDAPYPEYAIANASHGYWVQDMQQACWQGWHKAWAWGLGFPCTLIFCFLVPCGVVVILWCNRLQLKQPGFAGRMGFLYRNYKDSRYYWETWVLAQTVVLVAIAVYSYSLGPYYATLLFTVALLLFVGLQHVQQPYAVPQVHELQLASFCCLLATSYMALSLFTAQNQVVAAPQEYAAAIGWVGLSLNVMFVGWCGLGILMASREPLVGLCTKAWQGCLGLARRAGNAASGDGDDSRRAHAAALGQEEHGDARYLQLTRPSTSLI